MPRYDRIGPLSSPERNQAFAGWMTLRDLDGRDRDPELTRRARLRFLAIRPVRRLLERGIENVPLESFERQIEGVREELGHLPARDAERVRLAQYLHKIRQRTPLALVTAALDLGDVAETAGHYYGATEFYQTAFELARKYHLGTERIIALRLLGRVARKAAKWDEAEGHYTAAIEAADGAADRQQWARAMDGLGIGYRCQGNYPKARAIFNETLRRGEEWNDPNVIALASNSLSITEITAGELEKGLEHGWRAITMMEAEEERYPVLGNLGNAFTQLGLFPAAEQCYEIIVGRARQLIPKGQARADHAVVAAKAGDVAGFRARRDALMADEAIWSAEAWLNSYTRLELGRGSMLVGDTAIARSQLKEALATAEDHRFSEIVMTAETLLGEVKTRAVQPVAAPSTPTPAGTVAARIAGEVRGYRQAMVAVR